ncbi:replicative DNA helicase [Desulfomicrobium baculatum]|uniref:Replicative DNA helicase n=1 Tax=Desulfomicrobium baculatum (strain DSM 4028 / VKM B-1378 / X) TaxID=525897 RepID=C7LWN5_DESBD|nr:replicative DNA helicase [Desulfomicrobium baculatum]ACU89918.1 replicative DNA helicase [Desulfomicrobium baculatum DSM 4028]
MQPKKPQSKFGQRLGTKIQPEEALQKASSDLLRRVPPHNTEAEQAVLGGVFLRNDIFHTLVDTINDEDFYSPVHRIIYQAFQELYRRREPVDLVTVAEYLQTKGQLDEVGGTVYLASLAESVASASNAVFHAQIVRDKSVRRRLIQTSSEILTSCFEAGEQTESLLDQAEQQIFSIAESKGKPVFMSSKDLVQRVFEQLEARAGQGELVTGVPTGYTDFDQMTAGLQKSDLIILAARPSMGKTALALNMGMRAAIQHDVPVAVFSLEMSMDQLMMRLLGCHGRVDLSRLRSGYLNDEDWSRLYQSAEDLSRAPIYIDDTPALSTMEIRARSRRLKAEKGVGLIIVDYLQLMRSSHKSDSREQEISDISRNLKALAKELEVPVIALSQLNRKVEERSDKRPMISDLRESGAIEQDADVIVFIYRDAAYNKAEDNPNKNIAEIIIGKQRNGPVGAIRLGYFGQYTVFENLTEVGLPSEDGGAY